MRVVTAQWQHSLLARDTVPGYRMGFVAVLATDLSDQGQGRAAAAIKRNAALGCVSFLFAWVCAVATLTPRPPLPPAGEGEKRARARGRSALFSPGNCARGLTVLLPSPRVGERGWG
jgi:hypothetical protein